MPSPEIDTWPNETQKSAVRLVLNHYVPSSRNQLKGAHWSAEFHEKKRAALALKLCLLSTQSDLAIGTDGMLNRSSTASVMLDAYLATHGISLKDVCVREKFQRKKKNARK